ncbi:MAG: hypothetical protein NC215_00475 [Ruminococcus sp.]|nr:hypothetical protein [Ruminococcus sp.]MCM1391775.1 hypothetical protein [Ruminococcus sp.]
MIRRFFSDYKEMVIMPTRQWLRMHWKGYALFVVICYTIGFIIGYGLMRKKYSHHDSN